MTMMTQTAPFPTILQELVETMEYRPGWTFKLENIDRGQGSMGLTLIIKTLGYDSYDHSSGQNYRVFHYMIVPAASYNEASWSHWILDQCLLVEKHEACEFLKLRGKRLFAPHHGPGFDPYIVFHHGKDIDKRTMYTGEVLKPK